MILSMTETEAECDHNYSAMPELVHLDLADSWEASWVVTDRRTIVVAQDSALA